MPLIPETNTSIIELRTDHLKTREGPAPERNAFKISPRQKKIPNIIAVSMGVFSDISDARLACFMMHYSLPVCHRIVPVRRYTEGADLQKKMC
jgi:hypothetical protein